VTYRGRLTAAVQRELRQHGLSERQIRNVYVNEVDVSPRTPDSYMAVDCSVPLPPPTGGPGENTASLDPDDAVLKVRVLLDERTTLRILLNSLLDETNLPHGSRRIARDITDELNQAVYARLRRLAAPRTGPASDGHHRDDKS
jgi:hypothetical protein